MQSSVRAKPGPDSDKLFTGPWNHSARAQTVVVVTKIVSNCPHCMYGRRWQSSAQNSQRNGTISSFIFTKMFCRWHCTHDIVVLQRRHVGPLISKLFCHENWRFTTLFTSKIVKKANLWLIKSLWILCVRIFFPESSRPPSPVTH